MSEQGEKSANLESIDLPDTFTTKFMKLFPPIMFGIILLGITITGVVYGPNKIIELVSLIIGTEPTVKELTQCTLLVAAANILCLPSSMLEFVIAYQLGAWGLVPNILGDWLGCVVTYFIGRCLALPDPDPSNVTMIAVNTTIRKHPYQFAMLMRVAPLPSGFKNYGSGAIQLPAVPYIICTSLVAPFFSSVMTLVALSARGIMEELDDHVDEDGNVLPPSEEVDPHAMPLWVKLSLLVIVGGATAFLTSYTLRTVQKEIQNVMADAQMEVDQGDSCALHEDDDALIPAHPSGDTTPVHAQRAVDTFLTPAHPGVQLAHQEDSNIVLSVQRIAQDQLPPLKILEDAYQRVTYANHILTPKGRVIAHTAPHSSHLTTPLELKPHPAASATLSATFQQIGHAMSPRTSPNPRSLNGGSSPLPTFNMSENGFARSQSFGGQHYPHASGNAFAGQTGFRPLASSGVEHY